MLLLYHSQQSVISQADPFFSLLDEVKSLDKKGVATRKKLPACFYSLGI